MKLSIRTVFKNTMALLMARGVDALTMVLLIATISRYLGPQMYGEYAFVTSLVIFLVELTYFGIERIVIRNISQHIENAETIFGTALVTRWVLSIIAMIMLVIIMAAINLGKDAKIAILITAVSQLALASATLYGAVFKAHEKMEYDTIITLFSQFLSLLLVLAVIALDLGFLSIFIALAISNIGRFLISMFLSNRRFLKPKIVIDTALIKALLKDSFVLGINLLIIQALFRVDIMLLKAMKGSEEVSFFYAPHSLLLHLQLLPTAFAISLYPFLSRSAQNNPQAMFNVFEKAFKLLMIISSFITVFGMLFAPWIVTIIYGQAFINSTLSFKILSMATAFLTVIPLLNMTLISNNKQHLLIRASIVALITNVALDLVLIPSYSNVGASIGSLAGYAVLFGFTLYLVLKYVIKVPLIRLFWFSPKSQINIGYGLDILKKLRTGNG